MIHKTNNVCIETIVASAYCKNLATNTKWNDINKLVNKQTNKKNALESRQNEHYYYNYYYYDHTQVFIYH